MKEPKDSNEPKQATFLTPEPAEAPLSFRQAMDELEGILERIEGEEIDIDQLATELPPRRPAPRRLPRQDPQGRGRGDADRAEPGGAAGGGVNGSGTCLFPALWHPSCSLSEIPTRVDR